MIDLGLTGSQLSAYNLALTQSRDMRVRVSLLNGNEKPIASFTTPTQSVLAGHVNVDTKGKWTRDLDLTLHDPSGRFTPDPNSPRPTTIWPSNFIAVERLDYVSALDRYVRCPVFWGPIGGFSRQGSIVKVKGRGKESLVQDPALLWRTLNFPKGSNVVTVIRDILRAAGERRFDLPVLSYRLPALLSLSPYTEIWPIVLKLAASINRQVFYDGLGRVRLRVRPTRPVFTLYHVELPGKPQPIVLSQPDVSFSTDARNTFETLGPPPANARADRVRGLKVAARSHGLSPQTLARNGVPRHLVESVQNDKFKRNAEAQAEAERMHDTQLRIDVDVSLECTPVPHAEPEDYWSVVTEDDTIGFRMQQYTIPLTAAETMSIGSLLRPRVLPRGRR